MPRWSPEQRERALEVYQAQGLPTAHRETGVPKPTIVRWAQEAGIDRQAVNDAQVERLSEAAEVRQAQLAEQVARLREGLAPKLAVTAHQALDLERRVLEALDEDWSNPLPDGIRLRDLVGMRTRAIHDLNLLTGQATERTDGEQTIILTAPRPDRTRQPDVIDLGHADMGRVIPPDEG